MEVDIIVCIPELNYQKTLRLDHPLMSLIGFESRLRKSVSLPPAITFHQEKNEKSPPLDPSQTLKSYGYGGFTQEPKTLYIYFSPNQPDKAPVQQTDTSTDKTKTSKPQTAQTTQPVQKKVKKVSKEGPKEIMVTILNPYQATNHTFMAGKSMKLSELLEAYKNRIGWGKDKENLVLMSLKSTDPYNLSDSLSQITKNDEIILEARKEVKKDLNSKRELDLELGNDDIAEIIEKKVKIDDSKSNSSRKSQISSKKGHSEKEKDKDKEKITLKPQIQIIPEVVIEDENTRGESVIEFYSGFVDNQVEPMDIQEEGLYLRQGTTESAQETQILIDDYNE